MSLAEAEQLVHQGDVDGALAALQDEVRRNPARAELRIFLFQLLAVLGQWERAMTQLRVAGDLDAKAATMAQMYGEVIRCEHVRADVFRGSRSPLIFGEPDQWLALLIESLLVSGTSRAPEAEALRARAFESAPASSGTLDDARFEWIADGDMRLGPVCEAVINGRYYWVPFARLSRIALEKPADLRDLVWIPAQFEFTNGGEAFGVIPVRYPGSESADDAAVRLSRKTIWQEPTPGRFTGLGQRTWCTDGEEKALLEVRTLTFDRPNPALDSN